MSEPRKLYTGSASGGLDQEQYEAARRRAQQLAEQNARRRTGCDQPDRRESEPPDGQRRGDRHDDQRRMHPARQRDRRHDDQRHDGRPHPLEGSVDDDVVAHLGEKDRNDQNADERRKHGAAYGGGRSRDAACLVADEDRRVDGDGAGRRLRERQQLHEFVAGQPAPAVDDLRFDERDHGVAAAEGEESDLEKRAEKCG